MFALLMILHEQNAKVCAEQLEDAKLLAKRAGGTVGTARMSTLTRAHVLAELDEFLRLRVVPIPR